MNANNSLTKSIHEARTPDRRLGKRDVCFVERELEDRAKDLKALLDSMDGTPRMVQLGDKSFVYDPVVDLRTKVSAILWMVRFSEQLRGTARDLLLCTINRSLAELETSLLPWTRHMLTDLPSTTDAIPAE